MRDDRPECATCGGTGLEDCACRRWSDGDVGCSAPLRPAIYLIIACDFCCAKRMLLAGVKQAFFSRRVCKRVCWWDAVLSGG